MALTSFVANVTKITAAWLNKIDVLYVTVFDEATTKAQARAALTSDAPMALGEGGTGATTAAAARTALGLGTAALVADADLVHLAGTETVPGDKTFSGNNLHSGTQKFSNGVLGAGYSNNVGLVASVAASALTIALKGKDGNDPSATNPVEIAFRNATAATGDYTILTLTAATSLVISSGSTLGTTSAVASRTWIVGFNDGGTFRLGAINCSTATNLYALADDILASSTAEGGAGAADSAGVFYTGTAVTSKALRVLGYIESTQATAGTWATTPSKAQLWTPGMKLPGDVVQTVLTQSGAVATGTTVTPGDDTIPQNTEGNEFFTAAIVPSSLANILCVESAGVFGSGVGHLTMALFQDAVANALAATTVYEYTSSAAFRLSLKHRKVSNTVSSTTFKIRVGLEAAGTITLNGVTSARLMGGVMNSYLEVTELMG